MITKRRGMTAVTSKEHLIVAGGVTGAFSATCISTVEVMAMKTQTWSTVTSLPCVPIAEHQGPSVEINSTCWEGGMT